MGVSSDGERKCMITPSTPMFIRLSLYVAPWYGFSLDMLIVLVSHTVSAGQIFKYGWMDLWLSQLSAFHSSHLRAPNIKYDIYIYKHMRTVFSHEHILFSRHACIRLSLTVVYMMHWLHVIIATWTMSGHYMWISVNVFCIMSPMNIGNYF